MASGLNAFGAPPPDWTPPPVGQAHIWKVTLNQPTAEIGRLTGHLAPDERIRAGSFRYQHDLTRYVVARGLLRELLGRYLQTSPAAVTFAYGQHGKPFLDDRFSKSELVFSMTRSGNLALLAFASSRRIGIDLERIRPLPELAQLAGRVLAAEEHAAWLHTPPDQQLDTFYSIWTRKEALLKAQGLGLSYPMSQLDAGFSSETPCSSFPYEQISAFQTRWSLIPLHPAPGYMAALAVEGAITRLGRWSLTP